MTTEQEVTQSDDQLLRIAAVSELTTLSRSTINLWVAQGRFPRPISFSKTLKVWRLGEIRNWSNSAFNSMEVNHE